jgi:hypothetical protein
MVDKYKGVVELEIAGALRGFKFGTHAMSMLSRIEKVPFSRLEQHLDEKADDIDLQINFYWCAAVAYAKLFKKDEPTIEEVYAWADEGVMKILNKKTEELASPNGEAPNQPGQS